MPFTVYVFLFFLILVLAYLAIKIPNNYRAHMAATGIVLQTTLSLALFSITKNPLVHAGLFSFIGSLYVIYSVWRYGAALGICSYIISIYFVLGWLGLISTEVGQGIIASTVWHYKTALCYTQLVILWSMGRGVSNRISLY